MSQDISLLNWVKPDGGRKIIKTNLVFNGDISNDLPNVQVLLKKTLKTHKENKLYMDRLLSVFYNNQEIVEKSKFQRKDINNKISTSNAYPIVRTINSYCFGEPFKFLANDVINQPAVEKFNELLNYSSNYLHTISSTLHSAICGVGYKVALPTSDDEIPFKVNGDIDPRCAYVVYSDSIVPEVVAGVFIQPYFDKNGNEKNSQYTIWTKYHQYFLKDDTSAGTKFTIIPQLLNGEYVSAYPIFTNQVPLIEIPRNKFRLGDFELVVPLFNAKNKLLSDRLDDVDQLIDYLLVLTNCSFETETEKKDVLTDRLLMLKSIGNNNKSSAEILKNSLDQSATQQLADYIDDLIQEVTGIPSRQERSGGGGDTGQAVRFRNGFRDLENNAGMIVPEMEAAELKFAKLCLKYCDNLSNNPLGNKITSLDVKLVSKRTLTDDPYASSQAYRNYIEGGMDFEDALIAAKAVSDPAEVASRCRKLKEDNQNAINSASSTNSNIETSNTTI